MVGMVKKLILSESEEIIKAIYYVLTHIYKTYKMCILNTFGS